MTGTCHVGADSSAWYQMKTNPFCSSVIHLRTWADDGTAICKWPHSIKTDKIITRRRRRKRKRTFSVWIRNWGAKAVATVELPAVEGTLDTVADHSTTDTQMSSKMGTISVENASDASLRPESDQVLAFRFVRFFKNKKRKEKDKKCDTLKWLCDVMRSIDTIRYGPCRCVCVREWVSAWVIMHTKGVDRSNGSRCDQMVRLANGEPTVGVNGRHLAHLLHQPHSICHSPSSLPRINYVVQILFFLMLHWLIKSWKIKWLVYSNFIYSDAVEGAYDCVIVDKYADGYNAAGQQ